jgi:hypothetical protein
MSSAFRRITSRRRVASTAWLVSAALQGKTTILLEVKKCMTKTKISTTICTCNGGSRFDRATARLAMNNVPQKKKAIKSISTVIVITLCDFKKRSE